MILIMRENATTQMKTSINRSSNIDHLYFHDFILFSLIHIFCFFNLFSILIYLASFIMVTRGQQMLASHLSINVLQLI